MLYDCLCRRSMKPFGCKVSAVEPAFFQTSLIDSFQILFERAWSQCSSEVKEEYASIYAKCKPDDIKVHKAYIM